jgi:hypothetical protein
MSAVLFYGGAGLLAFALAELVWVVRAKSSLSRFFGVHAMMLSEMGLMLLAEALMPEGPARTGVVLFFACATGTSAVLLVRLARKAQRGA